MQQLMIKTDPSYAITFLPQLLSSDVLLRASQNLASQIIVIMDETINSYYHAQIISMCAAAKKPVHILSFPPGEAHKSRATKDKLEDDMLSLGCMRDTCILAIGGGIVTDVAGFVAATYCRGIPVIYIPTSLLAMVDASIGGKTGVNTPHGKNLIGTFTQPAGVYIDVDFLDTLPAVEFNNGIVEIIKHALIADKDLFEQLATHKISLQNKKELQEVILRSCDIKRHKVESDPHEKNMRQLLNLGHTVGHAIEAASDYQIRHGEAVAIGIIIEAYLSAELGILDRDVIEQLTQIFKLYDLPLSLPAELEHIDWLSYFKMDKKNQNQQVYCVLLEGIGRPYIENNRYSHPIEAGVLEKAMRWFYNAFLKKI